MNEYQKQLEEHLTVICNRLIGRNLPDEAIWIKKAQTEFRRLIHTSEAVEGLNDLPKVNRVEVINHHDGSGRTYVYARNDPFMKVETVLQDQGRTLKIFIGLDDKDTE